MNELDGYDFEDLSARHECDLRQDHHRGRHRACSLARLATTTRCTSTRSSRSTTPFKGRIAHGMLTASVISAAIAGRLPGAGTVYMGQNLRFKAPVRPGETVHAKVTVKELYPEKRRVTLTTVCTVGGKVVIDGEALVMPTSRTPRPG